MSTLEPGVVIADRYEILSLIKSGGMGAVYQARDVRGGPVVALKEMLQAFSFAADRSLIYRKFEEEARLLQTLNHPNIPRVTAHFAKDDLYYIVMEYIEGESLEQLLEDYLALTRTPMPPQLVVECALLLCPILSYLHTRQPRPIVHRDIKPGNIVLRKDRTEVVLVDFGLARNISATQTQSPKTMVGTLGYAAIEQLRGLPETRSDLYALGVTMHHLLSGVAPKLFEVEPLQTLMPELPEALLALVNRATQEEPELRFQTASEMELALSHTLKIWRPTEKLSIARTLVRSAPRLSRTSRIVLPDAPRGLTTGELPQDGLAPSEVAPLSEADSPTLKTHWPQAPSLPEPPVFESAYNRRASDRLVPAGPTPLRRSSDRNPGPMRWLAAVGALAVFAGGLWVGMAWDRHGVAPVSPSPAVVPVESMDPSPSTASVSVFTATPTLSSDTNTSVAPYQIFSKQERNHMQWVSFGAHGVRTMPGQNGAYLEADPALGLGMDLFRNGPDRGALHLSFHIAADSGQPPFVVWFGNCGVLLLTGETTTSTVPQACIIQWDGSELATSIALRDVRLRATGWDGYSHAGENQDWRGATVTADASTGADPLVDLTIQRDSTLVKEQARLKSPWTTGMLGVRVLDGAPNPLHIEDLTTAR